MGISGKQDFAKLRSLDIGDIIETCEALIQKGVVSVDEIQDAAILAHDTGKKHFGFSPHRQAEVFVEFRKSLPIRVHRFKLAHLQPLSAEVLDQSVRFWIEQ